ncbi:glucosyl transferase [Sphingobium sp. TA15]|uniref:Dolichol-phosphate mannosyltransferase n=1 Tax=Sphingobium indicum (strain DSM 16413 / CCM 7287 / MTCC 6362 / UT26 / NBRC 101211 / UT26S) TaxID=452662 RepID=D4Z5A9_SPHIU|nr:MULTISPECIES: glycosyltransferase family 2 protein [Sphingobium]WDA38632.1 glycosyltransferase family 2 protein [Sphingobium sp. YC-XJ3]BAI97791.1 dolichol-phosphate mannosyltransferase [Sphingobium indicum UT26S]BDD67186.1 glucosyl transferase [Sphingobium sp. TA15]
MDQQYRDKVPAISVVVPCFNEEESLTVLVDRVSTVCHDIASGDYEIVLVNDGSRDSTWAVIAELTEKFPQVVGVNLARNYGHQIALSAGLHICQGETVMVMDADLQDPPELLSALLAKMDEGYDVVYGQRVKRAGETMFKRASAKLFYRLFDQMVDVSVPSDTGDFRIMSRRVVDHLNAMPERYRFVRGMVSWIGFRQVALPYERDARFAGESHYPLRKMISFALDAITSFSTLPLRMAAHLGLVAGLLGMLMLGWVLISYAMGDTLTGWASIASIILILGSIQLLMLGIFGEYLGRMYLESKRRPLFIVQEVRAKPTLSTDRNHTRQTPVKIKRAMHG